MSGASAAIIVGTRSDGNPGVWVYSSNRMQSVIDEDSGQATCRLGDTDEQNGVFRGQFGWVYHVQGASGSLIVGYAENKKGFISRNVQVDPGTTIGVYWRVSRHHSRPFYMASHAHIIGVLDLAKLPVSHRGFTHAVEKAFQHALDQLKFLLINYLSSYLVMVDKGGVSFDSVNNVYLVTGTDQDGQPAVASIDQKDTITIIETPSNSSSPSVYVAGSYLKGSAVTAAYWKDGQETDLDTGGAHPAYATSMAVSGGSVYIAGYYSSGQTTVACYWVNGVRQDLPGATAAAYSIFVSGTTVYTAGYYYNGTKITAVYWTGTTRSADLPSKDFSVANSVFVDGSTLYVAGLDGSSAAYWLKGSEATLSSNGGATANSIFVSNGALSIAGQDTVNNVNVAALWTGTGLPTVLDGPNGAVASSIVVSGGTTYVAGQYGIGGTSPVACYWSGTTRNDLPGAHGGALSINVAGGTVYTAGSYGTTPVACYWSGLDKTDLPGANGVAFAIVVQ